MTVAAGRVCSVPLLRWFMVAGALFTIALFGGVSCGDSPLAPVSVAGHVACPNIILQASLPGGLEAKADGGASDGGHGLGETAASACLFVVVALAGLALADAVRGPLLAYWASWWTRLRVPRLRVPASVPMWVAVLRI
ncbi:hypothetical protein [Phytohabitans kaempferiae]|uniref:Lipoprotein n=1 Tax=Phytohabitans kaempferiae TaxID=1620943 RepID=A0ABV6LXW9_9ACTN